ncbi:MAG: hypothetical protein EOO16_08330, partial [Chitinophagaceae bacterium]
MNPSDALVTAARHYLREQYNYWRTRYFDECDTASGEYTDHAYDLFPRYNVLAAIGNEVERLTGRAGDDVAATRAALLAMGAEAQSPLTEAAANAIESGAMQDERDRFAAFLQGLSDDALAAVAPLPYRRRLSEEEREDLRGLLYERWGYAGDYWEPLEPLSPQPVCWVMQDHLSADDRGQLLAAIRTLAGERCFELTEDGIDAEVDSSLVETDGEEVFYCDAGAHWIVYA